MPSSVCIVGAGVIGVSTGVCIQENIPDATVTIVADKFTPDTTSDGSGGLWEPHALGNTPVHLMQQWSDATFKYLSRLLREEHANTAGVHLASGYHVFKEVVKDPDWSGSVYGFRTISESDDELKMFPGYKHGWFFTSIMCEGPRYLPWLTARFKLQGGIMIKKHLDSLEQVEAPWIKHFVAYDDFVIYIFPGDRTIALGGTHQYKDWRETNDEEDCEVIFKECCKLVPSLKKSKVLYKWAGLRPGRLSVRLEKENVKFGNRRLKVVHNYGHGGGGISLHWGCAQHAARLVRDILEEVPLASCKL
ncbi:D-aspartate oxidase-like isoform X2 [Ptychodera flava]|uniref:D-aspartate oxidase-like isoform X2 n=1 Tax=Ptychodera flava TaxID=63121 RepID=UPI00396AA368